MKFKMRKPSLKRSISARTSPKRILKSKTRSLIPKEIRKAKSTINTIANPKKAVKQKVYNKTTFSFWSLLGKIFK